MEKGRTNRPSGSASFTLLPNKVKDLIEAVLRGPGESQEELRQILLGRAVDLSLGGDTIEPPENLKVYSDKVARWAHKVLDEEVVELREAGYSDDQIFELTICSALGAGTARFEAGLAALEEMQEHED